VKRAVILLIVSLCASCTPDNDYWNGYSNWGQQQNQNTTQPQETDPSTSGVSIDDSATSDDNVANTEFDGSISIVFGGEQASVSGSVKKVSIEVNGNRVVATNSGDNKVKYILSGTCTDGSFKLYSEKKQAIVLNGLSLTNTQGAAINNQSKKRTFIVCEGSNFLGDGKVNADGNYPEQTEAEDMKAALFSEAQLIFSGSGSLEVKAVGKAGITSDDYLRFMDGSNVSVSSSNGHGIKGKDAIIVSGGSLNITLEASATGKKCCSTDSLMYIGGGKVDLVNKAPAGTVDGELTGTAGIKADKIFVIQGGELSVSTSGKGGKCISGDGNGFFEGGKVSVKASGANYGNSIKNDRYQGYNDSDNSVSAKAIKFDGNLEFLGAEVNASASAHEAIEAKGTIYISAGQVYATSSDDAINSASTLTISGGVVYACSTGNDGLDANGNLIIKGGTVFAIGSGSPEVGIDANTEQSKRFFLQGGNVIAISGVESNSSVSQAVISTSWSKNTTYSLCNGDEVIYSFKTPSSGGSGLFMSAAALVSGSSYSLKSAATLSGEQSFFDGAISIGGTASGGKSSSVTAGAYSSSGGNMGGGPGRWF